MDRQEWNDRYAAQPVLWDVDPGPFLAPEVGEVRPGGALDLGAGEGRTALWLAERGWQVTAVDFSEVALDRGRRRAASAGVGESIEWVCEDLLDYSPVGRSFELVLSMFVHLPAPARHRLLGLAVDALSPGGVILVVGYDSTHAVEGQGGPRDPAILFSPEAIVEDLPGLRVERAERLRVGDAVDAIVRAVKP
ncbi:MAG: class I SAM-dependent methyltransferase [Actinomycetota bacterium]|nr:class I SAM-dependent methyltransferase [Actinomycetota bacterium]